MRWTTFKYASGMPGLNLDLMDECVEDSDLLA